MHKLDIHPGLLERPDFSHVSFVRLLSEMVVAI